LSESHKLYYAFTLDFFKPLGLINIIPRREKVELDDEHQEEHDLPHTQTAEALLPREYHYTFLSLQDITLSFPGQIIQLAWNGDTLSFTKQVQFSAHFGAP
jgi:hypothetical protein